MTFLTKRFKQLNALPIQRRLVIALFGVFLITQTTAVLSSIVELAWLGHAPPALETKDIAKSKRPVIKPPLHPLEILPAEMLTADTKMRQKMPGSQAYAAEAIYVPSDEDEAVRNPYSVYVSIYYDPSGDSERTLKLRLADNGVKVEKINVGRHTALAGPASGKERYFVGWTADRYVFEIDGAFSRRAPGELEPMIEFTQLIAETLDKSAAEQLQSAGDR